MNRFTSILLAGLIASASALAISPKADANTPAYDVAQLDSYSYQRNDDGNYELHSRHHRNDDYDRENDLRNIRDNYRRYERNNNRRYERDNYRRYERNNNRRYDRENHRRHERENNRRYERENNRRYERDNDLRNIDNNRRYERDRGWGRY
ncbi:hypothetical protein [Nostoc sp. ChiSLP03a]|uniref:hypothetical protein n=1 Tax=Nostoc sp. ChiSLP03a TaxID=3075380 RepID=UPI002AD5876A|nr:hypothetical protein [Nostoc sp. ChiSLP03a]MDZ8211054.1 hypothetical protein [Nostoc sp. ChiSLP03a]